MSGNELTMDEKYFDLQNKLIEAKLSSISNALESFGKDVKKILDDHETRLREQAKSSTVNAQEIVSLSALNSNEIVFLKNEQKELRAEITCLRTDTTKRFDESVKSQEEAAKRELTLWQTVAIEALKYAAFGAAGSGVAVAIIKLLGAPL